MTTSVGLLCGRVRVEEKAIIAALAEAGVPACPCPPTSPIAVRAECWELDAETLADDSQAASRKSQTIRIADSALTTQHSVLLDRCQDRAVAAAVIPALRLSGVDVLDAGLAATGSRVQVAVALATAGLPRPQTHIATSEAAAIAILDAIDGPATLLPMTPGATTVALWDRDTAEAVLEHRAVLGSNGDATALIQSGAPSACDRAIVIVAGGQVAGIETGGDSDRFTQPRWLTLATIAARAVGASLCGVEIALTAAGVVVWDVLPVPDFRNARGINGPSVAGVIAAAVMSRVPSGPVAAVVQFTPVFEQSVLHEGVRDDIAVPV